MPIYKKYNKDFFKTWSHDMAYVLGFLYADGNIMKSKRDNCYVAFYSKDEDLLLQIKQVVESEHLVGKRKSGCCVLQIGSRDWFGDLGKIGLIPNKTKRIRMPEVPLEFFGDFVRGYFDGDGNVWSGMVHKKRKKQTKVLLATFTSCSRDFLTDLLRLLSLGGIKGGCIYMIKSKTYGRLQFSTVNALKLYEIMYNSPCSLFLDRKKIVFEKFMQLRP